MSGELERVRDLLWGSESQRLDSVESRLAMIAGKVKDLPAALAEGLEQENGTGGNARLANALAPTTAESLEHAVRKRPHAIVQALFPVIGPAIRRALQESLRSMAHDLDQALQETFTLKALRWRLQAWRTGVPYSQIALRHRLSYRVDHLFLICAESGLLLDHVATEAETEIDVDAVAGMLSAIEQFVHDSMAVQQGGGGLGSASVGEYRLLISSGPSALVAAFVRGVPPEGLKTRLDELVEALHAQYEAPLGAACKAAARGAILSHETLRELSTLAPGTSSQRRPSRTLPILVFIVLATFLLLGILKCLGWYEAQQVSSELARIPGVVVLNVKHSGVRKLAVGALYDPAVEQPQSRIERAHPAWEMHWQLYPQVSADPLAVAARVRRALALPDRIQVNANAAGQVRLAGTLPFASWYAVSTAGTPLPDGVRLNTDALTYPHRAELEAQVRRIETYRIPFGEGSQQPAAADTEIEADIRALARLANTQRIDVIVYAYGYTDEPGSTRLNRELRLRRAEFLADRIAANVPEVAEVDIGTQTISATEFHGHDRAARVRVILVPRKGARSSDP